jgi:hypothetical protein
MPAGSLKAISAISRVIASEAKQSPARRTPEIATARVAGLAMTASIEHQVSIRGPCQMENNVLSFRAKRSGVVQYFMVVILNPEGSSS